MVSEYKDIKQQVVKGVTGKFVGLALKPGHSLREEIWSGYKVNVIDADEVEHVICERIRKDDKDSVRHFTLPTKKFSVHVKIPMNGNSQHITLDDLEIVQFPMNLDEATTGHKLQGMTKSVLDIADYNYGENWIYVAMSRVRTSKGLFLFKRLNRSKYIGPSAALLSEIAVLEQIEQRTLRNLQMNGHFPTDIDITDGITKTIERARDSQNERTRDGTMIDNGASHTRRKKKAPLGKHNTGTTSKPGFFDWLAANNMRVMKNYHYTTGNCLFDSIAYLIPVWQGNGIGLRASAVAWAKSQLLIEDSAWAKFMLANYEYHDNYGKQTYQEYLAHIENPSVYATTLDLYMVSKYLEVGIVIYSSAYQRLNNNNDSCFIPNMEFASGFDTKINLYHDPINEHYEPIIT
jgi:hypothetical protein